jgi:hypothetical protein
MTEGAESHFSKTTPFSSRHSPTQTLMIPLNEILLNGQTCRFEADSALTTRFAGVKTLEMKRLKHKGLRSQEAALLLVYH